ncbi:MAG: UDP-glucose 4-epimerase GalE [Candidatus Tectomicrobia bacterium]|uniref:UDP-glucose 4-epimerase n=1 Tax=Tectimicrobiota bacterium TaxID=2528274 RepID=A0A932ML68_UNCTE|nr:UDP-glucose 4-epimerase GalE [Candidatus Tectomicrobia bacterium]
MNPAILVTGGAGFIGSHTCKLLSRAGYQPVVYDNLVNGNRWAVKWGSFVEGDLADSAILRRALREYCIKAVIHFAAYAYVGESMRAAGKYFSNNVINTLNLLEAMRETGVRNIVFSSSCATYGIPSRIPIQESEPQAPINPYGETKLMAEKALRWYGEVHGFRWTALRYFNAAGADPEGEIGEHHDPETHLIPLVIQAALGLRPQVEIFGTDYPTPDGTAMRDYIHVCDLADAHVKALEYLLAGGESTPLNLGTGNGHTVLDVIRAVERLSGHELPLRTAPRREGDPAILVADPSRAGQVLGWKPLFADLRTIVQTAWAWHTGPANTLAPCLAVNGSHAR